MSTLTHLSLALKVLFKRPRFAITVVLALGLGVGPVIAVSSILYTAVLRPLAYPDAHRLVLLSMASREESSTGEHVSLPDFVDWQAQSRGFEDMAALSEETLVLSGTEVPERVAAARVTPGFFTVFGLNPEVGSVSLEEWSRRGGKLVLLSHDLWQSRFGSDPDIVGHSLTLDYEPHTVVGVMPPEMEFPHDGDLWLPLDPRDPQRGGSARGARYLHAVGKLSPTTTVEQAAQEMRRISANLASEHPQTNRGMEVVVTSLHEALVGDVRPGLLMLLAAVVLVLAIVCANVAAMFLARGAARMGEMGLRAALGAGRGRLVMELLSESVLLALVGGALGLTLGRAGARLLLQLYPVEIPRSGDLELGGVIVLLTLVLSIVIGVIVGVVPALRAARRAAAWLAGRGGAGAPGGGRLRLAQEAILAVQLAVALLLLVPAGQVVHRLVELNGVDPGFRADGLVTARVVLPSSRYPEAPGKAGFFRELLDRLAASPGVREAAAVTALPMSGANMLFGFYLGENRQNGSEEALRVHYRAASPGYFHTLGVPLVAGREFTRGDEAGTQPVVVVNEAFARRFLPPGKAVGQSVRLTFGGGEARRVVGVVGDTRFFGLGDDVQPELYVPYTQQPWGFMSVAVRTEGDPEDPGTLLRQAVATLDPSQPLERVEPMSELIAGTLARPRFYSLLLSLFAGLALVAAAVGVYGLHAYWFRRRLPEIGVRLALGATPAAVRWVLLKRALVLSLAGVLAGGGVVLVAGRFLSRWLPGSSGLDLELVLSVAVILGATAVLAAWGPARRAARVDPVEVLRHE